MFKKIAIKIFLCIECGVLIMVLILEMVNLSSENRIHLTTSYIAKHDISPRSCITEDDLVEIKVPKEYLNSYVISHKDEIIGKYTDIQGKIPAGSLFYESMLCDPKDMPDIPSAQLKEGQTIFTLKQESTQLSNLVAGMRVDIIGTTKDSNISDVLIKHARILVIEDHAGRSIKENDGIGYQVLLAVNIDDVTYLNEIEKIAELSLRTTDEAYSDEEAIRNKDTLVTLE